MRLRRGVDAIAPRRGRRVTLFTGRTLTFNGLGTDHAWGGNSFALGGSLKGSKVFGQYPKSFGRDGDRNIRPDRGRLIPTTPWESVWAPIASFMGIPDDRLSDVVPNCAEINHFARRRNSPKF